MIGHAVDFLIRAHIKFQISNSQGTIKICARCDHDKIMNFKSGKLVSTLHHYNSKGFESGYHQSSLYIHVCLRIRLPYAAIQCQWCHMYNIRKR